MSTEYAEWFVEEWTELWQAIEAARGRGLIVTLTAHPEKEPMPNRWLVEVKTASYAKGEQRGASRPAHVARVLRAMCAVFDARKGLEEAARR